MDIFRNKYVERFDSARGLWAYGVECISKNVFFQRGLPMIELVFVAWYFEPDQNDDLVIYHRELFVNDEQRFFCRGQWW